MANIFGRQVVLPVTNKSGGQLVLGDVVVVDTSNDSAVTTTTSAGATAPVGIVQETIASNATGRVLFGGYTSLVNVAASVTRGHHGTTHTVAKQATSTASRGVGTFCKFLTGGTTPAAFVYPTDLLGSSLTNPMTTAGDIIYSSDGSGTPARLALGAAGGHVSRINGAIGWDSGTSFPSAATGDRYWRTDLHHEFFYDGTRWRCVPGHELLLPNTDSVLPFSATGGQQRISAPTIIGSDIWLESAQVWFFVSGGTALSGSHKWVGVLFKQPAGTTLATFTIDSGASSTHRQITASIGAALTASTQFEMDIYWTKTGTPGNIFVSGVLLYQHIAT